ncbi:ankyrin repeat-containing domain protein [Aspergillus spectabilis]
MLNHAGELLWLDGFMLLLERGAWIDAVDDFGRAALHYAIQFPRDEDLLERIAALIAIYAQCINDATTINIVDQNGQTALHYAVSRGSAMAVGELLKFGADHSIRDQSGNRALDIAIEESGAEELPAAKRKEYGTIIRTLERCSRSKTLGFRSRPANSPARCISPVSPDKESGVMRAQLGKLGQRFSQFSFSKK